MFPISCKSKSVDSSSKTNVVLVQYCFEISYDHNLLMSGVLEQDLLCSCFATHLVDKAADENRQQIRGDDIIQGSWKPTLGSPAIVQNLAGIFGLCIGLFIILVFSLIVRLNDSIRSIIRPRGRQGWISMSIELFAWGIVVSKLIDTSLLIALNTIFSLAVILAYISLLACFDEQQASAWYNFVYVQHLPALDGLLHGSRWLMH